MIKTDRNPSRKPAATMCPANPHPDAWPPGRRPTAPILTEYSNGKGILVLSMGAAAGNHPNPTDQQCNDTSCISPEWFAPIPSAYQVAHVTARNKMILLTEYRYQCHTLKSHQLRIPPAHMHPVIDGSQGPSVPTCRSADC